MPFAKVNNQRIHYEDSGGSGPALVFSHGLLMDATMFDPQVEYFRQHYRCVCWDERGHGQTATDSIAPFSYYDSANDLAALMQHLGIKRAVFAGMSQGGYLSLRLALTHPELVRGLILIDTQAQQEDPSKTPGYKQMIDIWTAQGLPDAIADTIADIILGAGAPQAAAWKAKWRTWTPHNLLASFQALVNRDDISAKLADIRIPALVIHGDADIAITLDRAVDMQKRLAGSRLDIIAGAGHASNLTHAASVNAAIERFLQTLQVDPNSNHPGDKS